MSKVMIVRNRHMRDVASLRDAFVGLFFNHRTALRLYGVKCTSCVASLREAVLNFKL